MGLSGQAGDTPTSHDTFETLTLGNSDNINLFILGEDRVDTDFLLKEGLGKVHLQAKQASVLWQKDRSPNFLLACATSKFCCT
jgi:hypothetical protein